MAHGTRTTKIGSDGWVAQRVRDAVVFAAGIALALPLILPFA